jgi:hypothetical protein
MLEPLFPLIPSLLQSTVMEGRRYFSRTVAVTAYVSTSALAGLLCSVLHLKAKLRLSIFLPVHCATNWKTWKQPTPSSFSCSPQSFTSELWTSFRFLVLRSGHTLDTIYSIPEDRGAGEMSPEVVDWVQNLCYNSSHSEARQNSAVLHWGQW